MVNDVLRRHRWRSALMVNRYFGSFGQASGRYEMPEPAHAKESSFKANHRSSTDRSERMRKKERRDREIRVGASHSLINLDLFGGRVLTEIVIVGHAPVHDRILFPLGSPLRKGEL